MRAKLCAVIVMFFCSNLFANAEFSTENPDMTLLDVKENSKAPQALKKGRKEVSAGFNFTTGQNSSYRIDSSVGLFVTDNVSAIGAVSLLSSSNRGTDIGLGFGVQKYFPVSENIAPFLGQTVTMTYRPEISWSGETQAGALYLFNADIGFRVFADYAYKMDSLGSGVFSLMGQFTIFF